MLAATPRASDSIGSRQAGELLADANCAGQIEAGKLTAIIVHPVILTAIDLTGLGWGCCR